MASFVAASGYATKLRSSSTPSSSAQIFYNPTNNYIRQLKNLRSAKREYLNAKKQYENQKRNVSGGLRGWINRRRFGNVGQQARQARNSQLNESLKRRLNNARNRYNRLNKNSYSAKRWYNSLYNQNRRNANWKINS